MTTIYCKQNSNEKTDFYMIADGVHYYLFSQKKYCGVMKYYRNGVCLKEAINHKRGRSDYAIHKTMTKLPGYIKYIEKEYGIAVLEQSKRKLQEAA